MPTPGNHPIYFGSIALERNRWAKLKTPTYRVSEWLKRVQSDGFDGIELWENHIRLAPEEEVAKLCGSGAVRIYNSYVSFGSGEEDAALRLEAAEWIHRLQPKAVKVNVGADPSETAAYRERLLEWADRSPTSCRIWLECHPGTVLEEPEAAADMLERLDADRFAAMVHPFHCHGELSRWLELLGGRVVHAHVQLRDEEGRFIRLSRSGSYVRQRLELMQSCGYNGSFTIEFTEGVRENEDPEAIYRAARDDMAMLRTELAEPGSEG
ncbi:sugar phosphate isomerase/epimerase [Paenibacillus sp. P26]|nr:sugar phosphate isomerase/epimerase [Paenibacillus sp. P26]